MLMVTKPDRIADLTKFAKLTKNRKFDDFSGYNMYLRFLAVYVHFHFSKFFGFFNFSQFLPLRTNLDIRADDVFHIFDLIYCKTVRIFAYSSSRRKSYPTLHRF